MDLGEVAIITVQTLGAYLTLFIFGATLASRPRKSPYVPGGIFVATLGRLAMSVFLPCLLLATLAKNLSIEQMRAAWPLFLWGYSHQFVGFVIGYMVSRLVVRLPSEFSVPYSLACAYGNCGALPLVLVQTLARFPPLVDDPKAEGILTTFIFMYLVSWVTSFWSVGIALLRHSWRNDGIGVPTIDEEDADDGFVEDLEVEEEEHDLDEDCASKDTGDVISTSPDLSSVVKERGFCKSFLLNMANPLMGAVVLGLFIGLIKPIQDIFFSPDAPLRFLSSAVETMGGPAVGVSTVLMSAALGGFFDRYMVQRRRQRKDRNASDRTFGFTSSEPPLTVPWKAVIALAVTRSLLVAGVNIAIVVLLADEILPDSEHRGYAKLVLMIESAVPAADTIIVVCQQFHHFQVAETLAASYLFMYVLGMVPLGIAIGISFNSFEFTNNNTASLSV